MKKTTLILFMCCIMVVHAIAQAPFNTADSIDVNNINARILVHGDMFWDPTIGIAKCYFPKNSPASINFASSLWISGYDADNKLHIAAQTYRQIGNDYWPGPLDTSDTLTYATSHDWAKIWKVNDTDITNFLGISIHTSSNTPSSILTWPGKGNIYAQGNAGVSLTISEDMAPFVDLNGNGFYEPLLGEYPAIKGNQALWWVFSDNGPAHNETKGRPLGIEVHAMTYAYNRGTLIDNVVYFDYTIINKSGNNYDSIRIGEWDDIDLGYYYDDFIGFDSVHRMGIQYNGTNDDGAGGGHPLNSYGTHIPMVGMTMIVLPGDTGSTYVTAGGFYFFNNDASIIGNPSNDSQYNHYLHGKVANGISYYDEMIGQPQCEHHDSNQYYCYANIPSDSGQCSECALNNTPGDRRFIITTNSLTLNAGSSLHIVAALVATYPDTLDGCPTTNFDSISIVADTAWFNYFHPPIQAYVKKILPPNSVTIYPNPAHDKLYIETTGSINGDEHITIYNTMGQVMPAPVTANAAKYIVDINNLPPGMYYMTYGNGSVQKAEKFVRE